jgi:hypothetical protein
MRDQEVQIAGLRRVAERVPGTELVVAVGYVDTPTLRRGDRELVYAVGGYDLWAAGGGSLLETDLSFKQAVEALKRA